MSTDDDSSRHRLIENEMLARKENKRIEKIIREHTPNEEKDELAIHFYCECSASECDARLSMTLKEYEQLHRRNDHFVVAPGHVSPTVEKLVNTKPGFVVVEKYALPA